MQIRSLTWKIALACAAAGSLMLGAQSALADDMGASAPAYASAPAAPADALQQGVLPPEQHAGAIAYRSGGIGSDQSAAFKAAAHHYPLSLEFARQSSEGNVYLSDVPVTIKDAHGTTVLDAHAHGPFMLVSLPNGKYVVSAEHDGRTVQHAVTVSRAHHAHQMFFWAKMK